MKAISHEEAESIRLYLIGALGEEEMESFEQRLVTDPDFLEQVLLTEDELIEDYLRGALPGGEREKFATHYLSTPHQLHKVRVAEALRGYPERVAATAPAASPAPDPTRSRSRLRLASTPALGYALAAALLLAACVGLWVFIENRRERDARQAASAALEQELARLNSANAAPEMNELAVTLSPGSVRGENELPRVLIPAGANVVNFRLELLAGDYPDYRVALRTEAGAEVFTWSGLRARPVGADSVRLRVPARVLTPGDYVLTLSGSRPSGGWQEVGSYVFRVAGGR